MKKAILLAKEFSKILNSWIPDKLFEVNLRNKEAYYIEHNLCATHDFCDSNQAIINAYKNLYGSDPSLRNKKQTALINKAWNIAKENKFNPYQIG